MSKFIDAIQTTLEKMSLILVLEKTIAPNFDLIDEPKNRFD